MEPVPIDEPVRKLSERGISTRRIVRELARQGIQVSQSTVVRARQRINSGPQPILPPGYRPRRTLATAVAAVAVALILLAALTVVMLARALDGASSRSQQVPACVRYDLKTGDITGITAPDGGGCPAGWKPLTLTAGG